MNTPVIQARSRWTSSVRGSLQAMTATGTVTVPRLRVVINKIPGTGQSKMCSRGNSRLRACTGQGRGGGNGWQ